MVKAKATTAVGKYSLFSVLATENSPAEDNSEHLFKRFVRSSSSGESLDSSKCSKFDESEGKDNGNANIFLNTKTCTTNITTYKIT